MGVDHGQDPQLVAQGQLVMNRIHRPDIALSDSLLAIIAQLGLHPPLRMLGSELLAQRVVNP